MLIYDFFSFSRAFAHSFRINNIVFISSSRHNKRAKGFWFFLLIRFPHRLFFGLFEWMNAVKIQFVCQPERKMKKWEEKNQGNHNIKYFINRKLWKSRKQEWEIKSKQSTRTSESRCCCWWCTEEQHHCKNKNKKEHSTTTFFRFFPFSSSITNDDGDSEEQNKCKLFLSALLSKKRKSLN